MYLVSEALEVEEILSELLPVTEESVKPKDAAGAKYTVEVEEDKFQELVVNPSVEEQGGVDDVQGVIEKRQALVDGEVKREETTERNHLAEGRPEVKRRGDDSHVVLLHARGECARAHAVVQADANFPRFDGEHIGDEELRVGGVGHHPAPLLQGLQVEAGAALEEFLAVLPVCKARVVAAVVVVPPDVLIGRDRPQGLVCRERLRISLWTARSAPPAWKRLAPPNDELLRYHPVVPAHLPDVVVHVLLQEPLVAHASVADCGVGCVHSHKILKPSSILPHLFQQQQCTL